MDESCYSPFNDRKNLLIDLSNKNKVSLTVSKIRFSIPNISNDDIKTVASILKSGWLTHGKYTNLFEMDDIEFSITPSAIDYIVEKAFEFKIGARGLRTLCEAILNDAMFNLPSSDTKELKITRKPIRIFLLPWNSILMKRMF